MVSTRKPKSRKMGERRPGESLEDMFQRLLANDSPQRHRFTKAEARYVGRRLWETGDPTSPSGEEVMRDFYGDWSEDQVAD
jgi:hypothetical protein